MDNSYCEKCSNFEGEVIEDHKKYRIICDCTNLRPFASSSLLCNIQMILNKHLKQKATMFAYGQLYYSKEGKCLVIEPESCATSREEIFNAWEFILGVQTPIFVLLLGLGLGISSCIVYHHQEELQRQAVLLANKGKNYI